MTTIDVFAEITCPFAYVGLVHVMKNVAASSKPVDIVVRSWPLEWVNGSGLAFDGVETKAAAMRAQLGVDLFTGLSADAWPASTIPGLALTAAAYRIDAATGLDVAMELRRSVFERGIDISDPEALATIAAAHGIAFSTDEASGTDDAAVRTDYEAGKARGVKGSPHYFVADDDFFCPALELGRDAEDHLTARFDPDGLAQFLDRLRL